VLASLFRVLSFLLLGEDCAAFQSIVRNTIETDHDTSARIMYVIHFVLHRMINGDR
jgi:hypothetical protein